MALFYPSVFIILLFFRKCLTTTINLDCTPEFCDDYVQKFPCPPLDPACSNPNISIILPSATTCNCCEQCFLFQEEGGDCVVGQLGQPLPKVMCKPGTTCVGGICKKMNGPDPDFYKGYECENGMCYCTVLENNEIKKIFGTFNKTDDIKKEKQCACSISAYNSREVINRLLPFQDVFLPIARCLPNGQFDPLQCIDEMCGCVNRTTGVWDLSTKKVPVSALEQNNPKCFDWKRHKTGEYYTLCERERNSLMLDKFWADLEGVNTLFSKKVKCTPDGEYETSNEI